MWGDDAESCMRIAFAADTTDDLNELKDVFELWAARGADRIVETTSDLVTVTSCAPYVP